MLGDQTSFSLLRSVRKTLNEGDTTFRTLQDYDTDNDNKSIIYIPKTNLAVHHSQLAFLLYLIKQ